MAAAAVTAIAATTRLISAPARTPIANASRAAVAAVSTVLSKNPGSQRSASLVVCAAIGCTDHWANRPSRLVTAATAAPSVSSRSPA